MGGNDIPYARLFRVIRLFRTWKLCHYFKTMRRMINTTWRSLGDIMRFSILLLLFVFVEALMGKELFAYRAILHEDNDDLIYGEDNIVAYKSEGRYVRYPRENFNTFMQAFTSVFIVIMGEDWNFVMYTWFRTVRES